MSGVMTWLSRLESTVNKHRLAAGKAARTVKATVVLDEILRTHRQEALSHDTPDLLGQAIAQLTEGDWRAQPKREANWQTYWRGLRLPNVFDYEGAVASEKAVPDIAWHPWLAERVIGPLSPQVKERLQRLNAHLFRQSECGQPLFPGALGHRERALLIFGDEKALDSMPHGGWKHTALTLADLGAIRRAPPLPYESSGHPDLPAVIVENSDVYYRLCQINRTQTRWSLVIYGAGNKVSGQAECVSQLLKAEQVAQLLYFGDLDVAGLKIAHQLHCKLHDEYGISLQLDERLYEELILNRLVTPEGNANSERFDFEALCGWMPHFVTHEMKTLMAAHQRLPQEGVANI